MAERTEIYEVATDEGLQFCFARNDDSCIIDTIYDTMYNASREVFIMSKWDKLLLRIRNLSKDLRFDELKKVMESYGYTMNAPKGGSSHYTFRKQGCQPITIPKHEPIKRVYVELVKQIVESEERNSENAE